jgi:serine/threonine protein kinase
MTPQVPCPPPERLRRLLDGPPEGDHADLVRHLDGCYRCARALRAWAEERATSGAGVPTATGPTVVLPGGSGGATGPAPAGAGPARDFRDPSEVPGHLGRLGPFEVVELLGRGGMGIVFKGLDPGPGRPVAIKVIAPHLALDPVALARFDREGRAVAAAEDPHVVAVHQVGRWRGLPYLVMEYVAGDSLQRRLERDGPLDPGAIRLLGRQVAAGLAAAHARGLIHRDVKPANILLGREGGEDLAKITDFGLVLAPDHDRLTQANVVNCTPRYASPEQARGDALDHRSDLFSLGSVLYALCTGLPPFSGDSTAEVLDRVRAAAPRPVRELRPDVPAWLADVIARLLARDPADRFQTAGEVVAALDRGPGDQPSTHSPRG